MFEELLKRINEETEDFDFSQVQRDLWYTIIKAEQKAVDISFDLENDDKHSDIKEIEVVINSDMEPSKVSCQLCFAGGDWESSVGYFRCQLRGKFFVVIPDQTVNKNLVKRDKRYSPIGNNEKDSEDKIGQSKDIESDLWKYLKEELPKRLKSEGEQWEPDYKKMRMYSETPR
jgi:hypothetical protein